MSSTLPFANNVPVMTETVAEVLDFAESYGVNVVEFQRQPPEVANPNAKAQQQLQQSQADGSWLVLYTGSVDDDTLRELVRSTVLRKRTDMHEHFRLWLLNDEDRLLPALVRTASMKKSYCEKYEDEVKARELIAAVAETAVSKVETCRCSINLLRPHDQVTLFHHCATQECAEMLVDRAEGEPPAIFILTSRTEDGYSVLDWAIDKDYRGLTALLRDIGCKSEKFNFDRLLDPAFQPMLEVIIPRQDFAGQNPKTHVFPFDPVATARTLARSGRLATLQKLFASLADVGFRIEDYPVAAACESGNMDVVWCVLDQMSRVGFSVHYGKVAFPHLLDVIHTSNGNWTGMAGEILLDQAMKLSRAVGEDDIRGYVPLQCMKNAAGHPPLAAALLKCVDVSLEPNPIELIAFFAKYDPSNDVATSITRLTFDRIKSSAGENMEVETFDMLEMFIHSGEEIGDMYGTALELVKKNHMLPASYRRHGRTLLMESLAIPPNVSTLVHTLEICTEFDRPKLIEQIDEHMHNAVKRAVLTITQRPQEAAPYLHSYMRAFEILLQQYKMSYEVQPPAFPASLFQMCARADLGGACWGLRTAMGTTQAILSCPDNVLAVIQRYHTEGEAIDPRALISKPYSVLSEKTAVTGGTSSTISHMLDFLPVRDLLAAGQASVRIYFLTLNDHIWAKWANRLQPAEVAQLVDDYHPQRYSNKHIVRRAVMSNKLGQV